MQSVVLTNHVSSTPEQFGYPARGLFAVFDALSGKHCLLRRVFHLLDKVLHPSVKAFLAACPDRLILPDVRSRPKIHRRKDYQGRDKQPTDDPMLSDAGHPVCKYSDEKRSRLPQRDDDYCPDHGYPAFLLWSAEQEDDQNQ
jgi:hypothetical protein